MLNEIVHIAKPSATILVYDFEVLLNDILESLGVIPLAKIGNTYKHDTNFHGLGEEYIKLKIKVDETTGIKTSPTKLAHLLLSDKAHFHLLAAKLGKNNLFPKIVEQLEQNAIESKHRIKANLFYSIYQVNK